MNIKSKVHFIILIVILFDIKMATKPSNPSYGAPGGLNIPGESFPTLQLREALEKSDIEAAKLVIGNPDCDINVHSPDDDNLLTPAYLKRDTEFLNMLMNNPKIHIKIKFHAACQFGDVQITQILLIEPSLDLNYCSPYKRTKSIPLRKAIQKDNIHIIDIILNRYILNNIPDDLLVVVIRHGSLKSLKQLIKQPSWPESHFHLALHLAVQTSQYHIARFLVTSFWFDAQGNSLLYAFLHDDFEMVNQILSHSHSNLHDNALKNLLVEATKHNQGLKFVKIVLEYTPQLINSSYGYEGSTTLFYAAKNGCYDIVSFLIEQCDRCDLNKTNSKGITPLVIALKNKHIDIAKLLLSNKNCDVNIQSNSHENAISLAYRNGPMHIIVSIVNHPTNDTKQTFIAACRYGDSYMVGKLLGHSESSKYSHNPNIYLNLSDRMRNTMLHIAIEYRHYGVVKLLIEHASKMGALHILNTKNDEGNTPIILAAKIDSFDIVKLLLETASLYKIQILNLCDQQGNSVFHIATKNLNLEVMKLLLKVVSDKDNEAEICLISRNNDGYTPISLAAKYNSHALITLFLQSVPHILNNRHIDRPGNNLFHTATENKSLAVVKLLLDMYSNFGPELGGSKGILNARNNSGDTPIILAVKHDSQDIFKLLLESVPDKLNINLGDSQGNNVLHIATVTNNIASIELLLKYASNSNLSGSKRLLNARNNDGYTPISLAAKYNNHAFITLFLQSVPHILNNPHIDRLGNNLFHTATENKSLAVVKLLLDIYSNFGPELGGSKGILNARNNSGDTPIILAVKHDSQDIFKLLLESVPDKLNINLGDSQGNNVLHIATVTNNIASIELLLKYASNSNLSGSKRLFNARNNDGNTPIRLAAKFNRPYLVKFLLNCDQCDANLTNLNHEIPLMFAYRTENIAIVKELLCLRNVTIPKNIYETTVSFAVEKDDIEIMRLLFHRQNKHLISRQFSNHDAKGESPLTWYLKRFGDCNSFNVDFWDLKNEFTRTIEYVQASPHTLAAATERSTLNICEFMLKRGADVNSSYQNNETSLHIAVRMNHIQKVKLLLHYKADRHIKYKGLNALESAIALRCHPKILHYLSFNVPLKRIAQYIDKLKLIDESPIECCSRLRMGIWTRYLLETGHIQDTIIENKHSKMRIFAQSKLDTRSKGQTKVPFKDFCRAAFFCHKPENQKEVKHIIMCVVDFVESVSSVIALNEDFAHLKFKVKISGSVSEGTKTFNPDEVDLSCEFQNTVGLSVFGLNCIKVDHDSPWVKACNQDYFLDSVKVAEQFQDAFQSCTANLQDYGLTFDPLRYSNYSLERRDKIACLRLYCQGTQFRDMPIYVDLVPTFNLDNRNLISKGCRHNNQLYTVAKQPIPIFQESLVDHEQAMMRNLPVSIKTGLIIAKAVRSTCICGSIDLEALAVSSPIDIIDFVTSYMLKNIAFELEPPERPDYNGSDSSSDSNNDLDSYLSNPVVQTRTTLASGYHNACRIYRELRRSMQEQGRVSSAIDDSPIFNCAHSQTDHIEAACCLKRRVILAICDEILNWLDAHRIDFIKSREEVFLMPSITYPR